MPENEIELLRLAKTFDQRALAQIYDTFSPELYRYAMRLLGDAALAEDCVADTFDRLLKAFADQKGPTEYLRAYMYKIAHNWITDFYRSKASLITFPLEDFHPDSNPSVDHLASEKIEQARIRKTLAQLTADQRQVIILKYYEGWDNAEIARAINKPIGAVKALQHRGIQSLKRLVEE